MKRYFHATIISFHFFLTFSFSQSCSACNMPVSPTGQINQWGKKEFQCVYGHKSYQSSANSNNPLAPLTKILKDRQSDANETRDLMNNLIRQRQQNNRIAEQRIQQEIKEFNQSNYILMTLKNN